MITNTTKMKMKADVVDEENCDDIKVLESIANDKLSSRDWLLSLLHLIWDHIEYRNRIS